MFPSRLRFLSTAIIVMEMAAVMDSMNAQSASDSSRNTLELATRQNNWIFGAYMLLLILVLICTYLLWKSGNNVQETIRRDANARIAQAGQRSDEANALAQAARADAESA